MKFWYSILCISALCFIHTAHAAGYKSVVITRADHSSLSITLEDDMSHQIHDGEFIISNSKGSFSLPVSEVQHFSFATAPGQDLDALFTGIESMDADCVTIEHTGDCITLDNLSDDTCIRLADIHGRIFQSATVKGRFVIDTRSLSNGIYILNYGNSSIKIAITK